MHHSPAILLLTALTLAPAVAQSPAYGYTDVAFRNQTGAGSRLLEARIYYPSTAHGKDVAIVPRAGGHPVIVFLNGFGLSGVRYGELGWRFANRGYVVVLLNTAPTNSALQRQDAVAMLPTLGHVTSQRGHFFAGAFDLGRVGLAGHSMGGASTYAVLAQNVGYRCGFGIAPADPGVAASVTLRRPVGWIHGQGDAIIDWRVSARTYSQAVQFDVLKFLYLFNTSCDHINLVGLSQSTRVGRELFGRTVAVMGGFFDAMMRESYSALDEVLGAPARAEPRLVRIDHATRTPLVWFGGGQHLGTAATATLACNPGEGALAVAAASARIGLPIGDLRLAPATIQVLWSGSVPPGGLLTLRLRIPTDPVFRGWVVPLQGGGPGRATGFRLSNLATLPIR